MNAPTNTPDLAPIDPDAVQEPETCDPLLDLVERTRENAGAPFEPEAREALAELKATDEARFEYLRTSLRKAGCRVTALDRAIAKASGGRDGEPDQLALAQKLVEEIGPENVLSTSGSVWKWDPIGVWIAQQDRAVKQWAQRFVEGKVGSVHANLVNGVADMLKTETFRADQEFDTGPPESVNTRTGELLLDAQTGAWTLHPHCREHYRTSQVPIEYAAEATAPRFEKFLREIFEGDADAADKRQAILEMMGYTLMAHCRHEKFIILVGAGANGKSVLLAVLEGLCGPGNFSGVQPSQFDRSFQRAHMQSKLANIVTEVKQGEIIDDASLKGIVSGEATTVEHKFQPPFVMRPYATCWFGTNHMPHTRDFSDALFRRALVVEFNQVFKPELGNCDPKLKEHLLGELPGILNLALNAYARALRDGFTMPASCEEARKRWRLEADQVAMFVEDRCAKGPGATGSRELYEAYKAWAQGEGIAHVLTHKSFSERLERLGFEKDRDRKTRKFVGLRLALQATEYARASAGL